MKIPLSRPDITKREIESVVGVLKTPYLSLGPAQEKFQKKFARYVGTQYAEAVNSGTSALHLVMKSLGIKKGDEVITSPYSFIASSNCILFNRAKPVFVDIDPETLNIDARKIEKRITKKTRAILAVHIFGMPADMPAINKIAKKYGLKVIEDACEAVGAEINGKKVGNFSDAAVFAFYPNKQITTGEGGMIVTDNRRIAEMCRSLKNQGRGIKGRHFGFLRLGYNYRLSDINCALGIAQLERINGILKKREQIATAYNNEIRDIEELKPLCVKKGYRRSWFVYVVKLNKKFSLNDRNKIIAFLEKKGIECGKYFPAIHLESFYREAFKFRRGDYPVTEETADRTFALPFCNNLEKKAIRFISGSLKKAIKAARN